MTRVAVSLLAASLIAACGHASATSVQAKHSPRVTLRGGPPAHIAVIVMENEEFGDIVGSPATLFITRLARRYALAHQMYAVTHPSLPNYLALTGGSTFGIDSDCTDCTVRATSLVDQLETGQITWRAYMEGLPRPCSTGADAGAYTKRHDPFAYYTRIVRDPARCRNIVPLTWLYSDERARALPRFIWITPDLCHDMHDCDPPVGDHFLAHLVPPLLGALGRNGLLVITWDEGTTDSGCCRLAAGGHVATILAGGAVRRGARLSTATDHYSVLQTIEDLLGLPRLRAAACPCTPSLAPLLR